VPIYEYLCHDCSYRFETKQSIKDDPVAICSKCGRSVGRIISAPAIMFKGSGWYITDYSDKMKPPAGESSSPAAGDKKEPAPTPAATTTSSASSAPDSPASGSGTSSSSNSTPASGTTSGSG
jgi:putative FmdB family regulatory protein